MDVHSFRLTLFPESPRLSGLLQGVLLVGLWLYPPAKVSGESQGQDLAAMDSTADVEFDREQRLLSVAIKHEPFAQVMERIAAMAGVQFVIDGSHYDDLTADFDCLPLDEGLTKLLKGTDHVILTSPDAPLKVWVFSKNGAEPGQEVQRFEIARPLSSELALEHTEMTSGRPAGQVGANLADYFDETFANAKELQFIREQLQQTQPQIVPADIELLREFSLKSQLDDPGALIGALVGTNKERRKTRVGAADTH